MESISGNPQMGGGQMQQMTQAQQQNQKDSVQINVQLNPRFIFGLKADVKNNIFYLDDQRVVYPAGHNVIIYNIEEKTQVYMQGIEGSEGITAMAVSPQKKFIAVCEKAQRAICVIYAYDSKNPNNPKRKKVLTSSDYASKEFVSCAFAPTNEKSLLATLTGEPDWKVILWAWDKSKCFTYQQVGVQGNMLVNQVSFQNIDHNVVLVTGNNSYKFYRVQENNSLKATHTQIVKKEPHISNNFTCHAWLPDGKLLVCTDQGEIMLLETSGDYKMLISESPGEGFFIESIIIYTKGFIIAGENGQIMMYEKTEDLKNPYHRRSTLPSSSESKQEKDYPQLQAGIMSSRIKSMAISSSEDTLLFTTENFQIMKVMISIDRDEDTKYEYLIYPFHSRPILGMDVCIKKHLIATCGVDKTIRIWNYYTKTLEICESYNDEIFSVAFHPSGFHIVAGFSDRGRMINVFQKSLKTYKELNLKGSREIRFSNGGHLFAAAEQHTIKVFRFYTGENPSDYIFKAHIGRVKCIQWLDDDSGFISGGWDGSVFMWKLNIDKSGKEQKETNLVFKYQSSKNKNIQFSCVSNKPDDKNMLYCCGTDKTIKEISFVNNIVEEFVVDVGFNVSQMIQMSGCKAFILGMAEDDRPGSIQVIRYPSEKICEIQAHSLPIERLRMSYDNNNLFSSGMDGVFAIFDIVYKDNKMKKDRDALQVIISEEILIQKSERDKFQSDIEYLKAQIDQMRINNEIKLDQELGKKNQKINSLTMEIENKELENSKRHDILFISMKDMEKMNTDKIVQMKQSHQLELGRRKVDYDDKMEADALRYQELLNQKQDEAEKFESRLNELFMHHKRIIKDLQQEQKIELEQQIKESNRLKEQIEAMMKEHKDMRDKIENDAWDKIDQIKEKNKDELAKIIDDGMKSKANLTLIHNEYQEAKSKREQFQRDIHEKHTKLGDLIQQTNSLKQQISSQKRELQERETTIKDKDKRIYELKKKTQELEKFKFVLDYKIKELKRDIGPRELEIQKLNEQTNKMRQELKHFNRVNQNLALIVDDLRLRQEGLTKEVQVLRERLDEQESYKKKFKDDVFECLHHIADFKKLKKGVIRLHKKYVKEEVKNEQGDTDLHKEYANKRGYLENNVNYLRQMLQKDQDVHKQENSRIMKENVTLLQEINDLRTEAHTLRQKIRAIGLGAIGGEQGISQRSKMELSMRSMEKGVPSNDIQKELKLQDLQIKELAKQIQDLEDQNEILRNQQPRVGKLPPLEAISHSQQPFDQDQAQFDDDEDDKQSHMLSQPPNQQHQRDQYEGHHEVQHEEHHQVHHEEHQEELYVSHHQEQHSQEQDEEREVDPSPEREEAEDQE